MNRLVKSVTEINQHPLIESISIERLHVLQVKCAIFLFGILNVNGLGGIVLTLGHRVEGNQRLFWRDLADWLVKRVQYQHAAFVQEVSHISTIYRFSQLKSRSF